MRKSCRIVFASSGMAILVILVTLLVAAMPISAQDGDPTVTPPPPSPTPFLPEATAEPSAACITSPAGTVASPDGAVAALVGMLNDEPLLDFFNQGGTVESLRTVLEAAGNDIGPYLSQVIEADVTGDGIPEIFVAITGAVLNLNYGESHLLMFHCVDGAYEAVILFRHAGAGARAEGLYTGGGAHILSIGDINANDAPDMVFVVDWRDNYGEYAEYYALEWKDGDFQSILAVFDILSLTDVHYIWSNTIGDFAFKDLDDDGVYELVVDGNIYAWDGEHYVIEEEAAG